MPGYIPASVDVGGGVGIFVTQNILRLGPNKYFPFVDALLMPNPSPPFFLVRRPWSSTLVYPPPSFDWTSLRDAGT